MVKGPHHSQSQPYACLTRVYMCLTRAHVPYVRLTCALHMPMQALCTPYAHLMRALQVYDWLRVPTTANQITDI